MLVYAATKNSGKLRELRAIFAPLGWVVKEFAQYVEPVEGTSSYADNAALKARALAAQLRDAGIRAPVVADDSGIEVAALGGRPGVLSARYGGDDATWADRRRLLLEEVAASGNKDRGARFVCALHLVGPGGRQIAVTEAVSGTIADRERGEAGFSYDAVFYFSPLDRTFGELTEEEKNAISHRSKAARALVDGLRNAPRARGSA